MAALNLSQERYRQADAGKSPPEYAVGDKVWLLSLHITSQRANKKLDHKRYGPFTVAERISSHAYRLELPDSMKIHDVFPATLLSPVVKDTDFNRTFVPPPPVITTEGEEHYEVDKFLDWRIKDKKWQYRVRWKGYGPLDDTWEFAQDRKHLEEQIRDFLANFPDAPAPDDPVPVSRVPVNKGGGKPPTEQAKIHPLCPIARCYCLSCSYTCLFSFMLSPSFA
ncbi:Retrotransposable element Tf2 protein [Ceratobasidium sp. AG-Ba]|nr:Retrotransposable element Tf2 protein [Ceratobasidium sp. AG-Ba]